MSDNIEAIRVARTWLNSRRPYLSAAVYSVVLVECEHVDLMSIDRHWRLYWNPTNLSKLTVEEQGTAFYHEVWHLLREHFRRAEALGISSGGKLIDAVLRKLWNYCADAEINDDASHEPDLRLPKPHILPQHLGCEEGLTAEQYLKKLLEQKEAPPPYPQTSGIQGSPDASGGNARAPTSPQEGRDRSATNVRSKGQGAGEPDPDMGGGSGSDGVTRPWEKPVDDPVYAGLSQAEGKLIANEVAKQILGSTGRGHAPSGVVRWATEVLSSPKIRWTDEVLAVVRGRCAHVHGCWDYTYSRPSRRHTMSKNIVFPSMYKPKPQVAAVIDTSGSMSDEQTGVAVMELSSMIKMLGVPAHVLSVDAAVHHVEKAFGYVSRKLYGGGGTEMSEGIKEALKLHPRPNVIVVFTDGLTSWPDSPPRDAAVVIALVANERVQTPEWAKTIHIDPSSFTVKEEAPCR